MIGGGLITRQKVEVIAMSVRRIPTAWDTILAARRTVER